MGVVTATFGVITNTRIYYDCPGCGNEVWAYPGFEGNRCWNCPGTIFQGLTRSVTGKMPIVSDITDSITTTTSDIVTDTRRSYYCKGCGKKKWAYGTFKGTKCWECNGPLNIIEGPTKFTINSTIGPGTFINDLSNGISGGKVRHKGPRHLSPSGLKQYTSIKEIRVYSAWIYHGAVGFLVGILSVPLTSNAFTHWWVEIETENSNEWYCAQFNGDCELELTRHYSRYGAREQGKSVASREKYEWKDLTKKHEYSPNNRMMYHVVNFMKTYDNKYDLIDNNCQNFARALWRHL